MQSLRIALDIDDVLCSFYPHACKKFGLKEIKCDIWDGIDVNKWIVDNFDEILNDLNFWKTIPVLSNPNSINFEVYAYVTYSPVVVADIRSEWLRDNGFPCSPILNSGDKLHTMIDHDIDVLIEDKPSTVNLINNSYTGKKALQFKPHYMTNDCDDVDKIITHLSEVNDKINLCDTLF